MLPLIGYCNLWFGIMKVTLLMFSALQWLRGTIEVHDEMDEMKQEQESMKLVPKVDILCLIFGDEN